MVCIFQIDNQGIFNHLTQFICFIAKTFWFLCEKTFKNNIYFQLQCKLWYHSPDLEHYNSSTKVKYTIYILNEQDKTVVQNVIHLPKSTYYCTFHANFLAGSIDNCWHVNEVTFFTIFDFWQACLYKAVEWHYEFNLIGIYICIYFQKESINESLRRQ